MPKTLKNDDELLNSEDYSISSATSASNTSNDNTSQTEKLIENTTNNLTIDQNTTNVTPIEKHKSTKRKFKIEKIESDNKKWHKAKRKVSKSNNNQNISSPITSYIPKEFNNDKQDWPLPLENLYDSSNYSQENNNSTNNNLTSTDQEIESLTKIELENIPSRNSTLSQSSLGNISSPSPNISGEEDNIGRSFNNSLSLLHGKFFSPELAIQTNQYDLSNNLINNSSRDSTSSESYSVSKKIKTTGNQFNLTSILDTCNTDSNQSTRDAARLHNLLNQNMDNNSELSDHYIHTSDFDDAEDNSLGNFASNGNRTENDNSLFISEGEIRTNININDFTDSIDKKSHTISVRDLIWNILIQKRPPQPQSRLKDESSDDECEFLYSDNEERDIKYTKSDISLEKKDSNKRLTRSKNKQKNANHSIGFFLQCTDENTSTETGWSCSASCYMRIMPTKRAQKRRRKLLQKPTESRTTPENNFLKDGGGLMLQKYITYMYNNKENDWGYATFDSWKKLTKMKYGFRDENGKVNIECDLYADLPHSIEGWDSKKHTGFIGLKNQGATCYMSSVLQSLYFTNSLRNAIYQIPTDNEETNSSIPLALQRVFYELDTSDTAACTTCLTKAFGWESIDAFMQHDAQEVMRVLMDNLENKMKGTSVENCIKDLFEGTSISYLKCINVDYERQHEQVFYDIQLQVKLDENMYGIDNNVSPENDKKQSEVNIIDSFRHYIKADVLDGDNKWDAGELYGKQDAKKGMKFKKFPAVLHLQLLRFHYDPYQNANVKINSRFVFTRLLNLTEFETGRSPDDPEAIYQLQSVLVHSGEHHGGHYVAYIDPQLTNFWYKFDDDLVYPVSRKEAMDANFGGTIKKDSNLHSVKGDLASLLQKENTNAYMLVYVRKEKADKILKENVDLQVFNNVKYRLEKMKQIAKIRQEEKEKEGLVLTCSILSDDCYYQGGEDLINKESVPIRSHHMRKTGTIYYLYKEISKIYNIPIDKFRLWKFERRDCIVWRPWDLLEYRLDQTEEEQSLQDEKFLLSPDKSAFARTISSLKNNTNRILHHVSRDDDRTIRLWLQYNVDLTIPLTPFIKDSKDRLLFVKYYDSISFQLSYVMHIIIDTTKSISDLLQIILTKMDEPLDTVVHLWEDFNKETLNDIYTNAICADPSLPEFSERWNNYNANLKEKLKKAYQNTKTTQIQKIIADITNGDLIIVQFQSQYRTRQIADLKRSLEEKRLLENELASSSNNKEYCNKYIESEISLDTVVEPHVNVGDTLKQYFEYYDNIQVISLVDKNGGTGNSKSLNNLLKTATISESKMDNSLLIKCDVRQDFKLIVKKIGKILKINPEYIQFFRYDPNKEIAHQKPISLSKSITMNHVAPEYRRNARRVLFFQVLDIPVKIYEGQWHLPLIIGKGNYGIGEQRELILPIVPEYNLETVFVKALMIDFEYEESKNAENSPNSSSSETKQSKSQNPKTENSTTDMAISENDQDDETKEQSKTKKKKMTIDASKYRLLCIQDNNKITKIWYSSDDMKSFQAFFDDTTGRSSRKTVFRIEEIPADQKPDSLVENEVLVTVFHYNNNVYQTHSNPFLIKMSVSGFYVPDLKQKLKSVVNVSDANFQRWGVILLLYTNQKEYPMDDTHLKSPIKLKQLYGNSPQEIKQTEKKILDVSSILYHCAFGLNHPGKNLENKRSGIKIGGVERAFRINC